MPELAAQNTERFSEPGHRSAPQVTPRTRTLYHALTCKAGYRASPDLGQPATPRRDTLAPASPHQAELPPSQALNSWLGLRVTILRWICQSLSIATARGQPAGPFSIFARKQETMKPLQGRRSRLVSFLHVAIADVSACLCFTASAARESRMHVRWSLPLPASAQARPALVALLVPVPTLSVQRPYQRCVTAVSGYVRNTRHVTCRFHEIG